MSKEPVKLTTVFEAMADGVCIINQDYTVEFMNKVMTTDFGEYACTALFWGKR